MPLSDQLLSTVRGHLMGDYGKTLMSHLADWGIDGHGVDGRDETIRLAREAGWIDERGALTVTGRYLADACREYRFWQERNGMLGWEALGEPLEGVSYDGRSVIEIGSGMGVNLMTLQARGASVLGIEPIEAYRQIGDILRAVAGEAPVEILTRSGEETGLAANSADIVLCVSSLQYCDIRQVIAEIHRILKPEGTLVIYGDTFSEYLGYIGARRKFGTREAVTLSNSLSYSLTGRRLVPSRSGASTSRPVYPFYSALSAWLRGAGFSSVRRNAVKGECLIVAERMAQCT